MGKTRSIEGSDAWNDPASQRLWLYNLHYFDDLNARDSALRQSWHADLLERWVRENPVGTGVGWEPYPLSLRIVNLIKWSLGGGRLPDAVVHSLALQSRYLRRRIEWHLLGNHLLANAKALVFAGVFFDGREADGWLTMGLEMVADQIQEQVLTDGGHFERSPMYHSIVVEDVLDLINLAIVFRNIPTGLVDAWREISGKMLRCLATVVHPDGQIPFFNDAAFDVAPTLEQLTAYASRLGVGVDHASKPWTAVLPESGYVRIEAGEAVALLDVAPVGPDYLPGHAHADTLSFELSIGTERLFVNSGTSTYELGDLRQWQRSTAAHNTVEVDGRDSSEVWASFRVARRARPFGFNMRSLGDGAEVTCSHDGYKRLRHPVTHQRTWLLARDGFQICDVVSGKFGRAKARFYLHPDAVAEGDGDTGTIRTGSGRRVVWRASGGTVELHSAKWFPAFGVEEPNQVLVLQIQGPACSLEVNW